VYNRKSWSENNSSVGAESVKFGYGLLCGIKVKTRDAKCLGEIKTEKIASYFLIINRSAVR